MSVRRTPPLACPYSSEMLRLAVDLHRDVDLRVTASCCGSTPRSCSARPRTTTPPSPPIDHDAWPFAATMTAALDAGRTGAYVLGLGVDPLIFATDMLAVVASTRTRTTSCSPARSPATPKAPCCPRSPSPRTRSTGMPATNPPRPPAPPSSASPGTTRGRCSAESPSASPEAADVVLDGHDVPAQSSSVGETCSPRSARHRCSQAPAAIVLRPPSDSGVVVGLPP